MVIICKFSFDLLMSFGVFGCFCFRAANYLGYVQFSAGETFFVWYVSYLAFCFAFCPLVG